MTNCDPNYQEAGKKFWIFHLNTLNPQALSENDLNKLILYFHENFDLTLLGYTHRNVIA